jgi:hypothetical protein
VLTDGKIATTGDSSGNLSFGLSPDEVKLFPEVEANYWVSEELFFWLRTLRTNSLVDVSGQDAARLQGVHQDDGDLGQTGPAIAAIVWCTILRRGPELDEGRFACTIQYHLCILVTSQGERIVATNIDGRSFFHIPLDPFF